jgi:hypothetical protein
VNYERNYVLYKKSDYLGQRKSLSLTYDTNMKIEVYYDSEPKELLATFTINGIDDVATNEIAKKEGSSKPKVSLSFELNRSGLIQLNKAEAKIEETYTLDDRILKTPSSKNATDDSSDN